MNDSDAQTIGTAEAESLLQAHYGFRGTVKRLAGERDHNFLVTTSADVRYVLKISHPEESLLRVRAQREALAHLAAVDPDLKIPRVIQAVDGAGEVVREVDAGSARIVRLLSYLEGVMLHQTTASSRQDRVLGAYLARVGLALSGYAQATSTSGPLWDLQRMPATRHLTVHLSDRSTRARVERSYDDFERYVAPVLPTLRAQPIHNDMNPYNVVMERGDPCSVAGLIDFGDLCHAPLVCDAAVAAAYRWSWNEHPLAGAARFLQGYTQIRALEDAELSVMLDLIRGRLGMIVNVGNWQALQDPANREYSLRLQEEVLQALERLSQVGRDEGRGMLHDLTAVCAHG